MIPIEIRASAPLARTRLSATATLGSQLVRAKLPAFRQAAPKTTTMGLVTALVPCGMADSPCAEQREH